MSLELAGTMADNSEQLSNMLGAVLCCSAEQPDVSDGRSGTKKEAAMLSRIDVYAASLGLLLAGPAVAVGQSSMLEGASAATKLPSYELMGFPISRHQFSPLGGWDQHLWARGYWVVSSTFFSHGADGTSLALQLVGVSPLKVGKFLLGQRWHIQISLVC